MARQLNLKKYLSLSILTLIALPCLVGCGKQTTVGTASASQTAQRDESTATTSRKSAHTDGHAGRKFTFYYDATISDLEPGAKARVWIPVATTGPDQQVTLDGIELPAKHTVHTEKKFGNRVIYFEAVANDAGQIPVKATYSVARNEIQPTTREEFDESKRALFLASNTLVPADGRLLAKVFGSKHPMSTGRDLAQELYDAVYNRMQYSKPTNKPWGRGDATFACDEKVGNCTDFHSLFISMARSVDLPARFEIGFPLPADKEKGSIGGYHCWAKFAHEGNWTAVDISEADKHPEMKNYYFGGLTPDRVTFTVGRDLELDPAPAAGPVNFLVYPYVEVDGKPHTKFVKNFHFEDVSP